MAFANKGSRCAALCNGFSPFFLLPLFAYKIIHIDCPEGAIENDRECFTNQIIDARFGQREAHRHDRSEENVGRFVGAIGVDFFDTVDRQAHFKRRSGSADARDRRGLSEKKSEK